MIPTTSDPLVAGGVAAQVCDGGVDVGPTGHGGRVADLPQRVLAGLAAWVNPRGDGALKVTGNRRTKAGCDMRRRTLFTSTLIFLALMALVSGCAAEPTASAPVGVPAPNSAPRPSSTVYFYPLRGQSAEQQDRDRYECYLWARRQTGCDPSRLHPDGGPPVRVEPTPPPGYGTAAGAATGAVIGAAVSQPWDTAEGAAIGAVAGAVIGAAMDASRQQEAKRVESEINAERAQANAQADAAVLEYRRAMQSCLEARGYAVK